MSHDTWLHRIVRVAVRPLVRTRVRPNHLTAGRVTFGLAAAIGFGLGAPAALQAGAACFLVSMLLDRADGELARAQGSSSAFGHLFDIIADALVNVAVMLGIGLGLRNGALGAWAPALGVLAGASVAYVLLVMVRFERAMGRGTAKFEGRAGFDPDDAMLAIPIAMLAGWGEALLIAAAIGAPVAAVAITLHFRAALARRT